VVCAAGCTLNSAKKHFVLAETLWSEGKYAAAVAEFEKAAVKDPKGKLGQQALYRAATTETLFLSQFPSAIRKYKTFAAETEDAELARDAQRQIADIYFSKLENYDQAILQYRLLVNENPASPEVPEFLFRIGRSQFFLGRFVDAVGVYQDLLKRFPASEWGEKAAFEIGVTHFTRGAQHAPQRQAPTEPGSSKAPASPDAYADASEAYRRFIELYPKSVHVPEAKFGIASCLEESEQLDAAYQAYADLKDTYPSRNVILIKLARIKERKSHRSH
jgi:TolA-binding protein